MPSGRPLSANEIDEVYEALKAAGGNKKRAAEFLGMSRSQFYERLAAAKHVTVRATMEGGVGAPPPFDKSPFAVEHEVLQVGTSGAATWEIKSRSDNKFRFGAFGDLHAASKYARWDVREDLTRRAERFGAQAILDTGNWIDGERIFNRYDVEKVGLDEQVRLLADRYPKTKLPTYAISGADHEGWYVRSEGIDVGRYCESIMREAGHSWTNLGFMQADIRLKNSNTGVVSILRLIHPSGGSAYATSYKPQKIVEAMEGGEKPDVLLIGHYHKLDFGLVRNVFYVQTGCCQDLTPFLATRTEVHVGGFLIEIEQDPKSGAIVEFTPIVRRYFNRAYYFKQGLGNQRWSGHGPIRQVPRQANMDSPED